MPDKLTKCALLSFAACEAKYCLQPSAFQCFIELNLSSKVSAANEAKILLVYVTASKRKKLWENISNKTWPFGAVFKTFSYIIFLFIVTYFVVHKTLFQEFKIKVTPRK